MKHALFASVEDRTISGLLLPFGELSSTSISQTEPIMFSASSITLPTDPSIVALNEEHSQFAPRGRAVELTKTDVGVIAKFTVARTEEGDALLAAANDPDVSKRPKLSAELTRIVRRGANAVSAYLTGAAITRKGAFETAGLFSALDDVVEEIDDAVVEAGGEPIDESEADTLRSKVEEIVKNILDKTTDQTPDQPAPAKEETMTASLRGTLTPRASAASLTTASGLFAALANRRENPAALEAYEVSAAAMFALQNVPHAGTSPVTTIGTDLAQPAYLGELWNRNPYTRKFWGLTNTAALTSYEINGWRWVEGKTPEVAAYAGNLAEIPSNAIDTEPVKSTARRIAGGHRIDRRFVDFKDQSFYDSYLSAMTESYARVSDLDALGKYVAAATTVAAGEWVPGVAPGLQSIVDGALAVIASENTPSFAVVSPELWRAIVLTGNNEVLGYLSASFGLQEGSAEGFKIIPGPVGTGNVLVGAKPAITMYELPGTPIRVEGLLPGNAGIEPAVYGYIGDVTHTTKALAKVVAPSAPVEAPPVGG